MIIHTRLFSSSVDILFDWRAQDRRSRHSDSAALKRLKIPDPEWVLVRLRAPVVRRPLRLFLQAGERQ